MSGIAKTICNEMVTRQDTLDTDSCLDEHDAAAESLCGRIRTGGHGPGDKCLDMLASSIAKRTFTLACAQKLERAPHTWSNDWLGRPDTVHGRRDGSQERRV